MHGRSWIIVAVVLALGACGFTGGGEAQRDAKVDDAAIDVAPGDSSGADAPADVPIDTGAEVCPPSYAAITIAGIPSATKYKFVNAPKQSWIDAEAECANDATPGQLATHLAVINTPAELTALTTAIDDQWIGLTDLAAEGSYAYVTLESPTVPVTAVMGTNAANKDCIRVKQTSGAFEIRDCAEANKYICECDGIAPAPSQFPNPPDGN